MREIESVTEVGTTRNTVAYIHGRERGSDPAKRRGHKRINKVMG